MSEPGIEAIRRRLADAASYSEPFSVATARRSWYAYTEDFRLPDGLQLEAGTVGGRDAEWTLRPSAPRDRVLLYLHGGGYVCGSPQTHRPITAAAAASFHGRVASLDYRLAPEHPCPAAVEDVVAAVEDLYGRGVAPQRLALAGESAGGGLAIAALVALRERALPMPGAAWVVSPWVDLGNSGDSLAHNADRDPIVRRAALEASAALYLAGRDCRDPLASPILAKLSGLPPLLVQVGSTEVLLDDALSLARAAGLAEVDVTLRIWPRMLHAWHIFHGELDEARLATAEAIDWLQRVLD